MRSTLATETEGEAKTYGKLGTVFQSLGEYVKANGYHEKALAINIEIGDRAGEMASYRSLGDIFSVLDENDEAAEYYKKASAIRIRMEDCGTEHEAREYISLRTISHSRGKYGDAIRYYDKALAITGQENWSQKWRSRMSRKARNCVLMH